MRVAIISTPWLAVPVNGYGGIELVVEGLVRGLVDEGIEVEIFGNGARTMPGIKTHYLYDTEQYSHIGAALFDSISILGAHMQFALNEIKKDGGFDIIHDHNGFIGPQLLAWAAADSDIPPVIHTLHGPPFSTNTMPLNGVPSNLLFWSELAKNMGKVYIVGISNTLMLPAPEALKNHILPAVHNAIDMKEYKFVADKQDYFITLARFIKEKGQHVAARICSERGYNLRMAGIVAGIGTGEELMFEINNPNSTYNGDLCFKYYRDEVLPYVQNNKNVTFEGNVSGMDKINFIANSKALLFPIGWDEPFGMAAIEALACGTPVVAMNRGAMSEIIEHGVNGFLANSEEEFEMYMGKVSEISPEKCRLSVEKKFSNAAMARGYIDRYTQAISLNEK